MSWGQRIRLCSYTPESEVHFVASFQNTRILTVTCHMRSDAELSICAITLMIRKLETRSIFYFQVAALPAAVSITVVMNVYWTSLCTDNSSCTFHASFQLTSEQLSEGRHHCPLCPQRDRGSERLQHTVPAHLAWRWLSVLVRPDPLWNSKPELLATEELFAIRKGRLAPGR